MITLAAAPAAVDVAGARIDAVEQTDAVVDLRETSRVADRILDAALSLVARWGVGKTTLADVAKAAGCSRATVYRAFPGGKQHLFHALAQREAGAYLQAVLQAVDAADDLAEAVTDGVVLATRLLRNHHAAQFVVDHEPGLLLPFLGFKRVDVLYAHVATVVGPHLERFLPAERAAWLAEWCARLFITYLFNPDPEIDLAVVAHTRGLVSGLVLPSFAPMTMPVPKAMTTPVSVSAIRPAIR